MSEESKKRVSLWEIFQTFVIIGATGFGGGMAIVSVTERCCVHKKKWVTHEEFLHGLAFGQILGPFSLNTCTFVGYYLRGIKGGIIAATGFLAPSFILITLLTWLYFRYNEVPALQSALRGTNPVVIALILIAAMGMRKSSIKGLNGWFIAVVAFVASAMFNVNALAILAVAGLWALIRWYYIREHR